MSISGLLITLKNEQAAESVERKVASVPHLTLGHRHERFIPAMLEAGCEEEARQWFEWLASVEGVSLVDVVFVSVDHPEAEEEALLST